jgi:hypothetical protein
LPKEYIQSQSLPPTPTPPVSQLPPVAIAPEPTPSFIEEEHINKPPSPPLLDEDPISSPRSDSEKSFSAQDVVSQPPSESEVPPWELDHPSRSIEDDVQQKNESKDEEEPEAAQQPHQPEQQESQQALEQELQHQQSHQEHQQPYETEQPPPHLDDEQQLRGLLLQPSHSDEDGDLLPSEDDPADR